MSENDARIGKVGSRSFLLMLQGEVAMVTGHRLLGLDFAIFTKVAFGLSSVCNLELVLGSGIRGLEMNS